jgi:hypothetical protein
VTADFVGPGTARAASRPERFRFEDAAHLEQLMSEAHSEPTLVFMDGDA